MNDPKYIVLHCSDSEFGDVSIINQWHLERGFSSIGYHYIVCNGLRKSSVGPRDWSDGLVEVGRAENEIGAHCRGFNKQSIGVCMIGKQNFTINQWSSVYCLVRSIMERYRIGLDSVIGHYETSEGIKQGKTCPNFNMDRFRLNLSRLSFDYRHVLLRAKHD